MGIHMVAVAKLHLQLTGHGLKPTVAGIVCPLILKLLMGFRLCRDQALHQSRLFLFRLGHIAFDTETPLSNVSRMERALRLIWGTFATATATVSTPSSPDDDDGATFHSLSMIAL